MIPLANLRFVNTFSRHSEYVAELFFLQNNGNMMEYPTWRKKSNTQQFISFMKSHRLEPPPLEEPEPSSRQVCFFDIFSVSFLLNSTVLLPQINVRNEVLGSNLKLWIHSVNRPDSGSSRKTLVNSNENLDT